MPSAIHSGLNEDCAVGLAENHNRPGTSGSALADLPQVTPCGGGSG